MDPWKTPVTVLFRYLLLHTPQGKTCLLFSAISILAGFTFMLAPTQIATLHALRAGSFFFFSPIMIFMGMLSISYLSDFKPSRVVAAFVAAFGISPFIFPYVHDIAAA